ncbi:nicotinate-nucleotide--dimethylbenzimidazole phosphoribosyltransferase [Sporolituus thermophilus]|uniref:Nicotinate-nucleotide--dimethylbenzimidazole phosphoribosyltransferase n=1 Tax=Sporolituus thermophilus DSM 23256 TaxID=1123285 RepID=A0A1G7I4Q6_9FIRM|nr:nicotinate-nucleotide--dimethylbenzimidazole phosphoribosyltransferase [Sporolituus thermophilus]SDF07588.1 nicotinate-nucleotide-dimethylbenzimidazole phosphoribosyltransferase [Sporolituus thermophilus DSM 23256]
MERISATIAKIEPLDNDVMNRVQFRLDNLTKPLGSLAALEERAKQLAGALRQEHPPLPQKAIILMAADHGVAAEGVSLYPQEVTEQMIYNFVKGGAAINVLARHANAELVLVDVGVRANLPADLPIQHRKVAAGTANMRFGPAMSQEQVVQALHVGLDVANAVIDKGVQAIALGEMGIGNTTASSAVTSALTGRAPHDVVGFGTGISSKMLMHKIKVVEEAIAVNRPDPNNVYDVLAKVGGLEIAALTGVILAAAARRVLVVLDGFISSTAALAAYRLTNRVQPYLVAAHLSAEPGHKVILEHLNLKPMLKLSMRLGEGTGAALGLTLVDAGVKVLNEMATFDEARVAYALQDLPVT